jgi:hypothetical protein
MKRFILSMFLAAFFVLYISPINAQEDFLNPYTPDENTVLLLHFEDNLDDASDSTAGGIGQGILSYSLGLTNLGNCLYINNGAETNHSKVIVPDTAALDITGSFTLESWVYFLTFGDGWDDWRGAPRIMAKPWAVNKYWWYPNYWLMGDSNDDKQIFGGGFFGINPDSSTAINGDLRIDYNFVETMKWYHVAFIYNHDVYPRTEQLLVHDEYGDLLIMLNNEIADTAYVLALSDSALSIGEGGDESPTSNSWLDGFVDEIRISTVARVFSTPPVIFGTTVPDNTTDTVGPYEIKTKVTDNDGIKSVTLKYDAGSGWVDEAMTSAVGDTFTASIPGQQAGTIIKYYIEAVDNNDEIAIDPNDAPTGYYSFAIIVEKALVFHLDFEEGSGTPVDKSQFAHVCTINGDVTYSTDAVSGTYSGQFNSSGLGYITAAASAFMNCYEFTVEMWIKASTLENNLRLISKVGATWYKPNYEIKTNASGPIEVGSFCDPGDWNNFSSDSIVTIDSWYHIAYVFKDTLATVYILDADDRIIDKVTKVQVGTPVFTTEDLYIGHAGSEGEPYFNGLMDEVKIYNYAKNLEYQWKPLTADEHTVLLCHFDGDLSDAAGIQPDGLASSENVGFIESRPGMGQALYLDNSTEGGAYITFADTSSLDLLTKYSIEASFILLSDDDSWNSSPRIWAKPSGEKPWYCPDYWGMVTSSNKFGVGYYTGSTWHDVQSEDGLCQTNTWYHMYMLYDETADSSVYFVVYDTLGAVIHEQTNAIGDKIDEFTTNLQLFIGFGGGGTDSYLNGYIDELRIQNYMYDPDTTAIGDIDDKLPSAYKLSQNYPNPFNPVTNITYNLPKSGKVELIIYNILGEKVRVLVNENQNTGSYKLTWNGKDDFGRMLSSGIYFYRLKAEQFTSVKKMILMK